MAILLHAVLILSVLNALFEITVYPNVRRKNAGWLFLVRSLCAPAVVPISMLLPRGIDILAPFLFVLLMIGVEIFVVVAG